MDKAAVLRYIESIPGWLSPREAEFLYESARALDVPGAILEIGSWQGRSTIALAAGSLAGDGRRVYAVDHFTGSAEHRARGPVSTFEAFREHIEEAGVSRVVTPIIASSTDAAPTFAEPIALLFIDGDHSYAGARGDFDAWVGKVVPGGCIAMHDSAPGAWEGPRRVVRESMYGRLTAPNIVHSITSARRAPASFMQRLRWPYVMATATAWSLVPRNLRSGAPAPLKRLARRLAGQRP
jgi:predicted O-methyltransferase YrrM